MKGYTGKYLKVNLSTGEVTKPPLSMSIAKDFIGGLGFGIKYLYDELGAGVEPLGESNVLLLISGPLAGTKIQSMSRLIACTKSPLTGGFAKANSGGDFGAWIKYAGYDFIMITGKSDNPVYLYITSEDVQLKDASELWRKDTAYTQDWLSRQYGTDVRTACIGIAGENLVKYAAIVSGRRTASRCGVGTVMGSKLLKAVTIKASKKNIDVYDPDAHDKLAREQSKVMRASQDYEKNREYGTTDGAVKVNMIGAYPVRNYRYGQLEGYENLSPENFKKYRVDHTHCHNCSVRCGKIHYVPDGPYAGARSEGPEYETYWAFSGPIVSNNIEATIAADQMCDDFGLDTLSTGNTIGLVYELYEKGIITKKDTDGLDLTYGNHASMIKLIDKIAHREGFGDILAEGSMRAAKHIGKGSEIYAMQVKGLEMAAYEPRALKGTGFGYSTSTLGGSHTNGTLMFQEFGIPVPRAVDRFEEEGKADIVIFNQHNDSLEVGIACFFATMCGDWYQRLFPEMIKTATGIEEFGDWSYLREAGERIWNLERVFNVREGFDRRHDTLPQRFQTEPLHTLDAPGEGQILRTLDKFLDEYYQLRGWTNSGIPSTEKLQQLGLEYAIKDVEPFLTGK
jgi:aldehyde:ferredoxin oxidoreductase